MLKSLLLLLITLTLSCRFPKHTAERLQKQQSVIQKAADYVLKHSIQSALADTLSDKELLSMLKQLKADRVEIIYKEKREFLKPAEPLDSIVVFSRTRKSSALMWGGEEIIYQFTKGTGIYPDYTEPDGYQFRKITERIYYRRYYYRET